MPGNVSYTEQGFQNPTPGVQRMNGGGGTSNGANQHLNMSVPSPASSLSSFGPNSPPGLPGQSLFNPSAHYGGMNNSSTVISNLSYYRNPSTSLLTS